MNIFTDKRWLLLATATLALVGIAHPAVAQTITEFPLSNAGSYPLGIATGPDRNLWFAESSAIGRISTDGAITEFPIPTRYAEGTGIAAGPDGNLWFTAADFDMGTVSLIGRITPAGVITEYELHDLSAPCAITAGPDGNLWFTECNINGNAIGRITTSGVITEFMLPTSGRGYYPLAITPGPDGNLWFTEPYVNRIGRITTDGLVTEFPIPPGSSDPTGIAAGPDGNLWFTAGNSIDRITTDGVITEFPIPTSGSGPRAITAGRDGSLWFTERSGNKIGRITTAGVITEFAVPSNESGPFGIAAGPDGNIWFTEIARSQIGRIGPTRSGAIDLTIGPDNTIRILRFGGGQMAVDSVDNAQAVSPGSPYGPYPGWTPLSMAAGDDSLTRVLWTNDDGTAALWLVGPEGNGVSHLLRAAEGWSATDVAASAADLTHVLWTDADGRTALWSIDNAGNVSAGDPRGPYPGWTAAAIADGEDGLSRVLWHSVDGSTALSLSGPQGLLASYPFGPVAGWTAADIAVGADGQARILWTHVDRRMALWRVDLAGNPTVLGPVYEPPAGFTASRIAAGSDGLTRVLWTNVNGAAVVWVLSADNELEEAFSLDPHPTSDFWDVTIRVTEATGPAFCGYTPGPGMAFSETYDLRRSGDSISFSPPDPFDWPSFTARLKGPNFTAKSRPSARDEACALTIHTPRVSREASRPVAINSPPRRPTPTPSIREK